MNIFYLDHDPIVAAKAMTNKHVVKMILESAQLMSTAHRVLDGEPYIKRSKSGARLTRYTHSNESLYQATHINHPSALWVRESKSNYDWLYKHFLALNNEYTERYHKTHASLTKLGAVLAHSPRNIPNVGLTPIRIAITNTKWHRKDPVESYRAYYIGEKLHTIQDQDRYLNVLYPIT